MRGCPKSTDTMYFWVNKYFWMLLKEVSLPQQEAQPRIFSRLKNCKAINTSKESGYWEENHWAVAGS